MREESRSNHRRYREKTCSCRKRRWAWPICLWLFMMLMAFAWTAGAQEEMEGSFTYQGHLVSGSAQPEAEVPSPRLRSAVAEYYGAYLDTENEYRIYNALKAVSSSGTMAAYSASRGISVELSPCYFPSDYKNSAQWRAFYGEFSRAVDAFLFDYSEEYWITGFECHFAMQGSGTGWKMSSISLNPLDYYSGIREEFGETETALQSLINRVTGSSRYELVKNAHDAVADLVTYASGDTASLYQRGYLHTITGGLLGKYGHTGVCDCYARLFRLICQAKEIPCILVPGGSQVKDGKIVADHIWNYVKMEDGAWYLVDVTWDDQNPDPYEYFLAGSGRTASDHRAVGVFSNGNGYSPFTIPALSKTDYQAPQGQQTTKIKSVTLNKTAVSLHCGDTIRLSVSVMPSNASGYQLVVDSSNQQVVSVNTSAGYTRPLLAAKGAGTAVVSVRDRSVGLLASCRVTVSHKTAVKTVNATTKASGYRLTYCIGCRTQISKQTLPKYQVTLNTGTLPLQWKKSTTALKIASRTSGDAVASWKSSNKKVVTVNSKTGKLTAKKKGTAVITVTMKSGARASCRVTVQKGTVKTKKLTPSRTAVTLKKGKKWTASVVRTPLTATDKLTWKSSNKKVAVVSSKGKITAKKKGTAVITVRSSSGKNAKIKVTVR